MSNPFAGADSELLAMATYYLGPESIPSMHTESPSLTHKTPTLIPRGSLKKVKSFKKLKRNERDRLRSFAKRECMQQMRQEVEELEGHKKRLVTSTSAVSPQTLDYRLQSPTSPLLSLYPSVSIPIKRENFVRLASEIEEFRHQNALMTQQLRERDVITGYMQNLLLEFSQDETDSESYSSTDTFGKKNKSTQPHGSGPRLLNGNSSVRFTPLTREEGLTAVRETLLLVNNARFLYASDANYHNRSTFLGWGQYTRRQGSTITFSVKKSLPNVTPAQLMATTWNVLTDEKNNQKLLPPTVNTLLRPLQKLSDDIFVIDRRTEDNARNGVLGEKLALRTVYIIFRIADADGSQTLAMKTINLPLVKKLLRDDEQWYEILYWMHFSPDGSIQSSSNNGDFATVTEFGGSNTYTRDEIAQSWLSELIFLAIRWESLALTPTLLKF